MIRFDVECKWNVIYLEKLLDLVLLLLLDAELEYPPRFDDHSFLEIKFEFLIVLADCRFKLSEN